MSGDVVSLAIWDQLNRALIMFREAVLVFLEDEWRKGETDYLRPAGVAYHVVETIDFYTGDVPAEEFDWGGRFGADWEDPDAEKLPTQQQLLAYLEKEWANLREWTETHDLTQAQQLVRWTGKTLLGRAGYVLRHIQHHTAEMALELTRRGCRAPEWR